MRKNYFIIALIFGVSICMMLIFGIYAGAIDTATLTPNANEPNITGTIEELSIIPNYAILTGQTEQMQIEEFEEYVWLSSVEWSSSNPDVISCTKNGEIKGLKKGKATITVKAKVGYASDSITVYCAKKFSKSYFSRSDNPIVWTCKTPFIFDAQILHFNFWPGLPIFATEKMEIKGAYNSYFYVEFERNEKQFEGFILKSLMPSDIATSEVFQQLSTYDLDVYVNQRKDDYRVTTKYKGAVKWTVSDTSIIIFDSNTGEVIGKKPGIATISATVGNKTLVCTVHSIYRWPLDWTGSAKKVTYVYKAKGNLYEKTSTQLAVGDTFTVKGDMGGNSSWAYGVSESGAWGYIPISHISTKGTISQYNEMDFRWPVDDINIKKISSPFGPRSSDNGGNHKGFDIVSDTAGEVEGEAVVASYKGTIKKIYIDNNKKTSHGNAIVITTDKIDPISGKNLTVIYMHLSRWNTNSSGNIVVNGKVLKEGDSVTKEQIIGCAGNTGYNTSGAHLHYEVNNQNAAIRSGSNNPFTETINPIYFYISMDESITKSDRCEAASNGNGFYWYGENE